MAAEPGPGCTQRRARSGRGEMPGPGAGVVAAQGSSPGRADAPSAPRREGLGRADAGEEGRARGEPGWSCTGRGPGPRAAPGATTAPRAGGSGTPRGGREPWWADAMAGRAEPDRPRTPRRADAMTTPSRTGPRAPGRTAL
jgi:hypothetical protein